MLWIGVGSIPQLIGGLLIALPEMDRGGVDGYIYPSLITHSVSSERDRLSPWNKNNGFWNSGRGEAIGVVAACIW